MISTISRDELKAKIDRGDEFKLVETLPEAQFKERHLPGAINLPPERIRDLHPHILTNKNEEIVVYCADATCKASEIAAGDLDQHGFTNIRRYVGGKRDWIDAGMATEGKAERIITA